MSKAMPGPRARALIAPYVINEGEPKKAPDAIRLIETASVAFAAAADERHKYHGKVDYRALRDEFRAALEFLKRQESGVGNTEKRKGRPKSKGK